MKTLAPVLLTIIFITTLMTGAFFSGAAAAIYYSQHLSNTYTKKEIDDGFTKYVAPLTADVDTLKRKVFPEAMKLAEEKKCAVDLKTMKCVEPKNEKSQAN